MPRSGFLEFTKSVGRARALTDVEPKIALNEAGSRTISFEKDAELVRDEPWMAIANLLHHHPREPRVFLEGFLNRQGGAPRCRCTRANLDLPS